MKKIAIILTVVTALSFSNFAHGFWFFRALSTLGTASNKALDITNKAVVTANAFDTMRYRRIDSALKTKEHLRFNNGLISSGIENEVSYNDREDADLLRREAWGLADRKAHHNARRKYEEALSLDANNSNTWHGYGYTLAELEKFDESQNAFETAIFLDNYLRDTKDESETWRYLGWNYHQQGYLGEAEKFYSESLAVNPENTKTQKALQSIKKFSIPDPATSKEYRITARDGLKLRSGPSTKNRIILTLPYDGDLRVLKFVGKPTKIGSGYSQWAQVFYQERIGYVFGAHIQKKSEKQDSTPPLTSFPIKQNHSPQSRAQLRTKALESLHFHAQRSHKHLLPAVGIQHRHGAGSYGVDAAGRSSTETLTKALKFIVQAGVFSSQKSANRLMVSLVHSGYKPTITKRQKQGKHLYYVEFVGFKNMNEARVAKNKIATMNPKESFFAKTVK